jgi:predicted flap endonuclease-1-like 5' DNA nuclease
MFRKCCFGSNEDNGLSWWWLGVKVGVVTALILLWWWDNKNKKKLQMAVSDESGGKKQSIPLPETTALPVDASVVEAEEEELLESTVEVLPEPDDLTKIEGIGPKINATLQEAGIRTFIQLSDSEPAALKQILVDAGIRMGYPDTWPEQAALAAKADWNALKEFQSGLQGGRRVES